MIAADFTLNKDDICYFSLRHLNTGHVYKDRLDLLETRTIEEKRSGCAVIWLTHFPPCFQESRSELKSEHVLVEKAMALDVPYILSGHTHRARTYEITRESMREKKVKVICAGSAMAYGEAEKSFYEFEIEVSNGEIVNLSHPQSYWFHSRQNKITGVEQYFFHNQAPERP